MLGDHRLSRLNRRGILTNESSALFLQNSDKSVERSSYSNRYPSSGMVDHSSRLNLAPMFQSLREQSQKISNYKSKSISGCNSDTELANGTTNNAAILDSDSSSKLSVNRWRVGCRRSLSSYSSGEEDNFSSSNFPVHYDNTKDVFFEYANSHNSKGSRQTVLKDFLRELPEPLFTEAFYQMIVNAHELHKTNNTSGEKLMLNILDCIPIGNQNVLLFLIDHIMKIIAKSDINKMDSVALANIFGPLLFYPSLEGSSKLSKAILEPSLQSEIFQFILKIWPNNVGLSRSNKYPHENFARRSRKETSTGAYKHRSRESKANSPENMRNAIPVDLSSVEKSHSYSKHIRTSKSRERQSRGHKVVVASEYYTNEPQSGRSHSKSDRGRTDRQRSHSRGRSQHHKMPEKSENHSRQHSQSRDRKQSRTRTHMPYS